MSQELKITDPPNDLDIIEVARILSVKLGSAKGSETKWEEFGMRLLQTKSSDDVWLIDPDRVLSLLDKYKGLLKHWAQNRKQNPKWDEVIKVLKEMNLFGLVTTLQKALVTTDHGSVSQEQLGQHQSAPASNQQSSHETTTGANLQAIAPEKSSATDQQQLQPEKKNKECQDKQVDQTISEKPFHTVDDLKKMHEDKKIQKLGGLYYNQLNPQQQDIVAKVQAMIIVVNDNEFMATMCYLKPHESQDSILKIQFKAVIGPDSDHRIFYVGKFGKCPVAVTRVDQGHGEDAVHHASKKYFKNLVLFAAVGVSAGFPENGVKLGDVLISDRIHDCTLYKKQDGVDIPRSIISGASKFMLQLLKDHFDWKYPCTKDNKRNAAVKFGLILSKSVLLNDADERSRLLKHFGPEAKGFEMEGFGIMNSSIGFIVIKGVCDFAGDKTKEWQPTAALAANDYLYHHFCQEDLSLLLEDDTKQSSSPMVSSDEQVTGTTKKPPEGEMNRKDQEQAKDVVEEDKTQGGFDFCKSALAKITANYDNLTKLPINLILGKLLKKKVILPRQKVIIEDTIKLESKRVEYLLDKIIIPSLEIEFVTKFKAFLEVMENDDDGLFKGMARTLGGSKSVPDQ